MHWKGIVVAVIIAAMSTAGAAVSAENPTDKSFFEGTWSGAWDMGPTTKVDVTITIGQKNEKGFNKITYAWGWGKSASGGASPPGSFDTYGGVRRDGVFQFWWKEKDGTKRTVTMERIKEKEDVVKARMERDGPSSSIQRPYYDATLKRN